MSDIETNFVENDNKNDNQNINEKIYKTKDYVRRAINKYQKKRYAEDEEYREKQIEYVMLAQKKKPEKYKEYKKIYMREYRAKKKEEKQKNIETTNTDLTQDLQDLTLSKDAS
jgi:hypothetical protein